MKSTKLKLVSDPDASSADLRPLPPVARLPLMRNFDDAEALYHEANEPFYLAAFLIQCWLGGLVQRAAAEYAEKKNPKDRSLQRGEAWRAFLEMFHKVGQASPPAPSGVSPAKLPPSPEPHPSSGCVYLLSCLFRFSVSDDSPGNSLRNSLIPLSIEHHCTGDYFGAKTPAINYQPSTLDVLARRTIIRWCDWLEADIHLRTHRRWHTDPACFHPDPETRELAVLGNAQRHLAHLSPRAQVCWLWDFASALDRYKDSPKWATVGKAMAAAPTPRGAGQGDGNPSGSLWTYEKTDTLVIALWPLVNQYNWTYRDLLTVIRPAVSHGPVESMCEKGSFSANAPRSTLHAPPGRYPCSREQDFAAYCANVLGLRKASKGIARGSYPTTAGGTRSEE